MLTLQHVKSEFLVIQEIIKESDEVTSQAIVEAGQLIYSSVMAGGTIFFVGNGGSAAQTLHLAGEFVGKFHTTRKALPAIALGDNFATLTAVANDFSYEMAFARQLEAFGRPGDVLVGLSTSGNSGSVVSSVRTARKLGIATVALTGMGGGALSSLVDVLIAVPANDVAHIQEVHQIIGHLLCSVSDMTTT